MGSPSFFMFLPKSLSFSLIFFLSSNLPDNQHHLFNFRLFGSKIQEGKHIVQQLLFLSCHKRPLRQGCPGPLTA